MATLGTQKVLSLTALVHLLYQSIPCHAFLTHLLPAILPKIIFLSCESHLHVVILFHHILTVATCPKCWLHISTIKCCETPILFRTIIAFYVPHNERFYYNYEPAIDPGIEYIVVC